MPAHLRRWAARAMAVAGATIVAGVLVALAADGGDVAVACPSKKQNPLAHKYYDMDKLCGGMAREGTKALTGGRPDYGKPFRDAQRNAGGKAKRAKSAAPRPKAKPKTRPGKANRAKARPDKVAKKSAPPVRTPRPKKIKDRLGSSGKPNRSRPAGAGGKRKRKSAERPAKRGAQVRIAAAKPDASAAPAAIQRQQAVPELSFRRPARPAAAEADPEPEGLRIHALADRIPGDSSGGVLLAVVAGLLLAGGVVLLRLTPVLAGAGSGVLSWVRLRARRTLPPPQAEPAPEPEPAALDAAAGWDLAARAVRTLAARAETTPMVEAVEVATDQVRVHAGEAAEPVAPFVRDGRALVVREPAALPQASGLPPMNGLLVTLGHGPEGAITMVNLLQVRPLAIVGPPEETGQVLRALAVELAMTPWAATTPIQLIGVGRELAPLLGHDRLSYADTVIGFEDRPGVVISAEPLPTGRGGPTVYGCPPDLIDADSASWRLDLAHAVLQPIGLHLEAQRLDDDQYAAVLHGLGQPGSPELAAGPELRVFGGVELVGAPGVLDEPARRERLTELIAYLHYHPDSPPRAVDQALELTEATRKRYVAKARAWLSPAHFPCQAKGGRYRLDGVISEGDRFRDQAAKALAGEGTERLTACLEAVRGQPFADLQAGRYVWADAVKQDLIDDVVAVAHELATRLLDAADPAGARKAVAAGRRAEPGSDLLGRDALLAHQAAGNAAALRQEIDRIHDRNRRLGIDLDPQTAELIDRLVS